MSTRLLQVRRGFRSTKISERQRINVWNPLNDKDNTSTRCIGFLHGAESLARHLASCMRFCRRTCSPGVVYQTLRRAQVADGSAYYRDAVDVPGLDLAAVTAAYLCFSCGPLAAV